MKAKSLIILVLSLCAVILLATILYPKLKEKYEAELDQTPPVNQQSAPEPTVTTEEPTVTPAQQEVSPTEQPDSEKPETVPDFTVFDSEGNAAVLSDFFGKPVIVNFWATWCGPCKAELPAFNSAAAKYGEEISFLMVNLTDGYRETVDGVKAFVEENQYTFPVYYDTEYSADHAYGVNAIPMTLFINTDGTLMDYHMGSMSDSVLNQYIEELIKTP